jgi:hypothetical protein
MDDLFIKEFLTSHPLMRGIETLQGMSIREARILPKEVLPARASALIETQKEPVLWALGRNRYTDLVMTFPLVVSEGGRGVWNTNWPRQPAGTFPLFFDNVVLQLGRFQEYEDSHAPGVPKTLDPGAAIRAVEITRIDPPGGQTVTVERQAGRDLVYGSPEYVGLYEVIWGEDGRYRFAVNLFDPQESNIQPREAFQVGEETVKTTEEPVRQRRQLWPWFVLAALLILLLEWAVYNRRIYV